MIRAMAMILLLGLVAACSIGPTSEPTPNQVRAEITVQAYLAATRPPEPTEAAILARTATPVAPMPTQYCPEGWDLVYPFNGETPEPAVCSPAPEMPRGPSPVEAMFGDEVGLFRIQDVWECGAEANECMWKEEPALILARIAIGEAPDTPDDQLYVMWLIKLRAYLGFKHAGVAGDGTGWCGDHWCDAPDRWGSPTTIREEALCYDGCQFSPARAAQHIWFPCQLNSGLPLRKMLCPLAEQLPDFDFAYHAAQRILGAPMGDFPKELRGYDNFRSYTITGPGQCNRSPCGLLSIQFFRHGNIWRDEFTDDNAYWAGLQTRAEGEP